MQGTVETPIYKLYEDSSTNNQIYIKREDLLPFSLGGNKVRIARELFSDMKEKRCNMMLIYGNSRSNLCRVLANLCRRKRIDCYMICSGESEKEQAADTSNSRMIHLLGTSVISCEKSNIAETVESTMRMLKAEGKKPYYIYGNQYGKGNEGVATRAYAKAYREMQSFDYIFHASGTGATQAGLVCGHLAAGDATKIVGISVSRDTVRGKEIIKESIRQYMELEGISEPKDCENEIILTDQYRAGGYGVYHQPIVDTIVDMFQNYGIPLDPTYTGKAFWGMEQFIKEKGIKNQKILFLHTGGTPLFYDWLYQQKR